jgi:hypothetical protein
MPIQGTGTNFDLATLAARWEGGSLQINNNVAGAVFYVNSTHANASNTNTGTNWAQPCATIDGAVNKCTANQGDLVMVAPDHTENLAADSAIDIDQAGVTVYGIRRGREMPTLTVTAAAGDCKLAAARCSIHNLRFLGGIDVITGCIEVSAADCAIIGCEFRDVTGQATDVILTTTGLAADRLLIDNWRHLGSTAAGTNSSIAVHGCDDLEIKNFFIEGNFAVGAIDFRNTLSVGGWIHDGIIRTHNAADICIMDTITGSQCAIGPNVNLMVQDNAGGTLASSVTGATFWLCGDVYACNAVNERAVRGADATGFIRAGST